MKYSGSILFIFPCKLKNTWKVRQFNKRWKRWRDRQIRRVHSSHSPLTDLMDLEMNREENEYMLSQLQASMLGDSLEEYIDVTNSPYALTCLRQAYRKNREDSLFAKNANILLSRFTLKYEKGKDNIRFETEGVLLYNINADNLVGSLIIVLDFKDFTPFELIMLKHIFYKRLVVTIEEHLIDFNNAVCQGGDFSCINDTVQKRKYIKNTTIQEYANNLFGIRRDAKKMYDIDFRARYSFMELSNSIPSLFDDIGKDLKKQNQIKKELYGILYADEGYQFVSEQKLKTVFELDFSTRMSYSLFIFLQNVLLITTLKGCRQICKEKHKEFEELYSEHIDNIKTEPIVCHCIPGILEEYFPAFLKASEIHYLINNIMTSEIEVHDKSYIYPWIFLKRLKVLWEVLYELDINRYHINGDFLEQFGVNDNIKKIQKEYDNVLAHAMSYFAALIAIFSLIFTVLQIWK